MNPKIGILLPVYNEELVICNTISALIAAGCSVDDVYVVDDCSTDKTVSNAVSMGVNVVSTPVNGGKASGQRFALAHFRLIENYDWLIFMDGDSLVDVHFYSAMSKAVINFPEASLFLGQVCSIENNHIFSAYRAVEYAFGFDILKGGQDNFGVVYVSPGCASMFKTQALRQLSIESDTLAEDMDLTIQIHRINEKAKYVPGAIVNTQDPGTFKDYFQQVTRWSRGFWQVALKHKVFKFNLKKQRVDWFMMYASVSELILNRFTALLLFSHIYSLSTALLFDMGIYVMMSTYACYKTRRLDVLYKSPITYFITYINSYAFVKSFVEIILLRKNLLMWNKAARYNIDRVKRTIR